MAPKTTRRIVAGGKGRSTAHQTALVRTFGGLEVRDAKADLRIPVTAEDVAHAERRNPERCVFAMACHRHFGSSAAVFFKTYAYVDIKGEDGTRHVERFIVNGAAQKLIAAFDSIGPEGVPTDDRWLVLKAPNPSRSLDRNLLHNRAYRKRRKTLKAEFDESETQASEADEAQASKRGRVRGRVRELEIRDGSGKWQMIKQSHKSELAPKVVAAIRQAREEALAIPTGEGKPRRYAPMGLAESLAERYGVTPDRIKQIWGGRVG